MEYVITPPVCNTVEIGGVTVCVTSYKLMGTRVVTEAGTAAGGAVVTASYQKGAHLTLRGRLLPQCDIAAAAAAFEGALRSGVQHTIVLEHLTAAGVTLCQYVLQTESPGTGVTLLLHTSEPLVYHEVE